MAMRWLSTLSASYYTPLVRHIWASVLLWALYAAAVAAGERLFEVLDPHVSSVNLHALLGTVLGLLLVFRTNTAYDRWWEGRKLWGQLVNESRNLSIKVHALEAIDRNDAHHCGRLLVNFAFALKEHLREGIDPRQLSVLRYAARHPEHVPLRVAGLVCEKVRTWRVKGLIDGHDLMLLDPHVRALMDVCGACERIRKTPISRSYLVFIRQCIGLYLFTLPWGLVDSFGFWTVPAVAIVAYFMIGLDRIAEDVEEPFGREDDDLMLDHICHGIEASVTEVLSPVAGKTV